MHNGVEDDKNIIRRYEYGTSKGELMLGLLIHTWFPDYRFKILSSSAAQSLVLLKET